MSKVLPEAWELVEDELITKDDFRDFTFANAVRLCGTKNPDFFEGTAGRQAAAEVLKSAQRAALARRREVGRYLPLSTLRASPPAGRDSLWHKARGRVRSVERGGNTRAHRPTKACGTGRGRSWPKCMDRLLIASEVVRSEVADMYPAC